MFGWVINARKVLVFTASAEDSVIYLRNNIIWHGEILSLTGNLRHLPRSEPVLEILGLCMYYELIDHPVPIIIFDVVITSIHGFGNYKHGGPPNASPVVLAA